MRDLKRVSSAGLGKSRGFGFINFADHTDALQALHATNNSTELFGEKKVGLCMCCIHSDRCLVDAWYTSL